MELFLILLLVSALAFAILWSLLKTGGNNKPVSSNTIEIEVNSLIESYLVVSDNAVGHYLVFDIESTGLPKDYNAEPEDLRNWPSIVSIGYLLYDIEGKLVANNSFLIKQKRRIPKKSTMIHGITNEMCETQGIEVKDAIEHLLQIQSMSSIIIAHNIKFDLPILQSMFLKENYEKPFTEHLKVCTMESSTDFCQLENYFGNGYKYPKLTELLTKCFEVSGYDVTIHEQHKADMDALFTAISFFKLMEFGIIRIPK